VSTRTIRSVLERFTANGNTVVFSSHVMEVVERLCDRVAVVHHGRLVAEGATDDLRAGRRLEDVFVELVGATEADVSQLDWLGVRPAPSDPTPT
jgi:ABC-2 type transport system ATP-binding protein